MFQTKYHKLFQHGHDLGKGCTYKEIEWPTIARHNVKNLTYKQAMIHINWIIVSNCIPKWSNRGQFGFLAVVLPDVEDDLEDDNDIEDAPTSMTSRKRHKHQEACEDIEYK